MSPAQDLARSSADRLRILKKIVQRGPAALTDEEFSAELIAAAGRVAGGIVTQEDLDAVLPTIEAAATHAVDGRTVATVPWGAEAVRTSSASPVDGSRVQIVAAVDARGLVAIAAYENVADDEGLAIPELGLVAPRAAAAVLRGATRVSPGAPRPASAPIAMIEAGGDGESPGAIGAALGVSRRQDGERALIDALVASADGASPVHAVGVARSRLGVRALIQPTSR